MPDHDSLQQSPSWPPPIFCFQVRFGDSSPVPFQKVSGLETTTPPTEYRSDRSTASPPILTRHPAPGGLVTVKRGLFPRDSAFWSWFDEIKRNLIKRRTVTIVLLDPSGRATMTWTLLNAWPTRVTGSDLESEGNEVAVESVDIAYERGEVSSL